jgi:hypothetical protein
MPSSGLGASFNDQADFRPMGQTHGEFFGQPCCQVNGRIDDQEQPPSRAFTDLAFVVVPTENHGSYCLHR